MRVLIISKEAWRNEQNGGNVLTNIFENFSGDYAQIYCTDALPNNSICKSYYQMTDNMMVNNILHNKKVGKEIKYENYPYDTKAYVQKYNSLKKCNLPIVPVLREIVWKIAKWDIDGIKNFVLDFNPDVIFAPCYGSHYMIKLTKIVKSFCDVPVISYISDDFYTNKQFNFSIIYWLNHFILRKHVSDVFKLYDLVYTMTNEQKSQCEKDFHANMKILRKVGNFDKKRLKTKVNNPIRFVYAGGIYLNRWKTLVSLAESIKKINKNGTKMVLDIYTTNEISPKVLNILNDNKNSFVHKAVSLEELKDIYSNSDIALHVEGFDIKNKMTVRLSFSTKIVDCLDSGCAVMAICDDKQAGFSYLKKNNAALCIDDKKNIYDCLLSIINNPQILIDYQKKAFDLGTLNHSKDIVIQNLKNDFEKVIGKSNESVAN
jgi:hypothetical protein